MKLALALLALAPSLFAADVRTHFVSNDYDEAIRTFSALASPSVEDQAFAAASYLHMQRSAAARNQLETLRRTAPDSPWRWYVEALIHNDRERMSDTLSATDRMMALAGANPDEEMLKLRMTMLTANERRDEALALADARPQSLRLRAAKAGLLLGDKPEEATALFEALRRDAPDFLDGYLSEGRQDLGRRRYAKAYGLLKQAAAMSTAVRVHADYWRAVASHPELSDAQKKEELEKAIDDLRTRRGERAEVHLAIAQEYARSGDARAEEWRQRVLEEAPGTVYAARALWTRFTAFSKQHGAKLRDDPKIAAEARKIVRAYLDYPTNEVDSYRDNAHSAMFMLVKAIPDASPDELLEAARNAQVSADWAPGYAADAAMLLADRGVHLEEAERIAREGFEHLKKMWATESDRDYVMNVRSWMHDALGWVLLKKGDPDAARNQLFAAYELNPDSPMIAYHLGQWYEARKEYDKAEQRYRRGTTLQTSGVNHNEAALRALYVKRHGTEAGFEAYRKSSEKADVTARRSRILAARKRNPSVAPDFRLQTLDGKEVSLASLKGKTAVVNFWGIWCSWCVKEMPEYQQLAKKYANDPKVAILTINNDGDVAGVRKWMAAQKYDFNVMLDDGFVQRNKLTAFPTTWFLDGQGRIAFEKKGWTRALLEEFSWRVEELKAGR